MKSHSKAKWHALLQETDVDSQDFIAQEMEAEGLSGVPDEDTWILNSRLGVHHVTNVNRQRRFPLGLAG